MSTEIHTGAIYGLIPKVMKDIGSIGKNRKNEQQRYAFRGIEDFYQAAHPAMIEHGIFCAPEVQERDVYRFEKTNDQGRVTSWLHVALKVKHRFFASDGSFVDVTTCGEGLDNSDKATNKAMSGAMKYALIELFCVPTQDVEDSDRESPETGVARKPVERTTERIPVPGPGEDSILPDADKLITADQCKKLHMRFRESLREELKPNADKFLYDFLGSRMYVDKDGNPTAKLILKEHFAEVGKAAVKFAEGL